MALERIDNGFGGQLTKPCFCRGNDGKVGWTNGRQYTRDGTAPGRVEIFFLNSGRLSMTFDWADQLVLATSDEANRFREQIIKGLEAEIKAENTRHETKIANLKAEICEWQVK